MLGGPGGEFEDAVVLVLLMICNRNGITSVGRGEFVESSLKLSLKISWQSLWQSILPHLLPQKMIVRISLKFRQRFRYFNSSLTKFERIVWQNFDEFFLWQNVVAKRFATTFCHKKNSSKFCQTIRSNFVKLELK